MKPIKFNFFRAASIKEAIDILASHDGDARLLAGGQSLVPMLNLRLARPAAVVDISALDELKTIEISPDIISIGALVTHATLERAPHQGVTFDLLRKVAGGIAYRGIRNRGTIGGSIAHCDPAADWLSCASALKASIQIAGPTGTRQMPVMDFVVGSFTTALEPGEMLTRIDLPLLSNSARWGYYKHCRKIGEFAEAIGCVIADDQRPLHRIVAGALPSAPALLFDGGWPASLALADLRTVIRASAPDIDDTYLHFHAAAVMRALQSGGLA